MNANLFVDPDIIDYPELSNIYGGFAVFDSAGNGCLAVPVQQPDAAPGKGRRSLGEDQRLMHDTLCAWSLRAFHIARAAGKTPEEALAMLGKYATSPISAESARTIGRRVCRTIFGFTASQLGQCLQHYVETLRANQGEEAVETLVAAEFETLANLGRAYKRGVGFDADLYDAFHGRSPGAFHEKMAKAINPRPSETHLSLPIAAHLSFLTGVNLAFLWQDQWLYRLVLGAAAALNAWTHNKPANLSSAEFYTLFRCVESADPDDPTEHGLVKCVLARLIDDLYGSRPHFLDHAEQALIGDGLLPDRPHTVAELVCRCSAIVDDNDEPDGFEVSTLRML